MHSAESREPLEAERLRRSLAKSGGLWRRIDVVEETGSTNADLLACAAAGEDIEGAVLLAEYQTAGRGRHGRHWTAPPRSQVAMSVGIGLAGAPSVALGWLPLLAGVAVVDALQDAAGITAGLKWPNDVLVGGRKLAGILAEVAANQAVAVVGIGLNVSMTIDEAPDAVATSLVMLDGEPRDRCVLIEAILGQLADRIGKWRSAGSTDSELTVDYRRRSVTIGAQVRALLPGDRLVEGLAVDVDSGGRLQIDTGGELVTVSAGDITRLRPVNP